MILKSLKAPIQNVQYKLFCGSTNAMCSSRNTELLNKVETHTGMGQALQSPL